MEKWHLALVACLLLLGATYYLYTQPPIGYAEKSGLSSLSYAYAVKVVSGNFSAAQGLSSLSIQPVGGYFYNATLYVFHDDPNISYEVFSNAGVEVVEASPTVLAIRLPVTDKPVELDILYTFSNTTTTHEVTYLVEDMFASGGVIVYANP